MRIALLGTRGIPANYGGFETFYENLGPRLADRGHQVWVYNRPHVVGHRDLRTYRVVNLVHLLFDASTRGDSLAADLRTKAVDRVGKHYSWEHVTDMYEQLFARLIGRRRRGVGV